MHPGSPRPDPEPAAPADRLPGRSLRSSLLVCALAIAVLAFLSGPAAAQQSGECFGTDVTEGVAGEEVELSINCGGYVLVGGDKPVDGGENTNFFDVLYVSGGGTTTTVNTRLLGTDRSAYSGGVVSYAQKYGPDTPPGQTSEFSGLTFEDEDGNQVASTLAEFEERLGVSRLPRPLQPARFRLLAGPNATVVLGDDGVPYLENPLDRSNLRLTEPSFEGDLGVAIAPTGAADEEFAPTTSRDEVAVGDRIRIDGFDTSGFRGTLAATDAEGLDMLRAVKAYPEGVNVTIEHTNPGTNEPPEQFSFDGAEADDLFVSYETGDEEFHVVLDTSPGTWFGSRATPGDEFEVTFAFEGTEGERYRFPDGGGMPAPFSAVSESDSSLGEQYPYFESGESTVESTTTFTVVEPRIEYDPVRLTRDGELIVGANGQHRITGTTTYAPGTELSIQLISRDDPPPTTIRIDDVTIAEDGTFRTPPVDYSVLDPEHEVEAELFLRNELYDRRPVVIAQDPANPADLELADATGALTITEGETLAGLAATVRNVGVDHGNARVLLDVDGERWGNQSVTVPPDRNRTVAFDGARPSLPPGEYPYTVRLADSDQTRSGTLTIRAAATPVPTDTPTTAAPTPEPTGTATGTDDPPTRTVTQERVPTTDGGNESAAADDSGGSLLGGVLGYLAGVVPYTLGSMVLVITGYVVARVVVARRGGESAS
ncbi:BGTF surface domain-containing protein [Halorientalis halophila]|uniref:BGTF surface domain-containing protein n=1 Tax=Halorientalis halophila TaxID=3108499 RepID=UPI00300B65F5